MLLKKEKDVAIINEQKKNAIHVTLAPLIAPACIAAVEHAWCIACTTPTMTSLLLLVPRPQEGLPVCPGRWIRDEKQWRSRLGLSAICHLEIFTPFKSPVLEPGL